MIFFVDYQGLQETITYNSAVVPIYIVDFVVGVDVMYYILLYD